MARASEHPEQWGLVLEALRRDDIELARQLTIKYEFGKDSGNGLYTYYWEAPDGRTGKVGNIGSVMVLLDRSMSFVNTAFREQGDHLTWDAGDSKGWFIRRVRNGY